MQPHQPISAFRQPTPEAPRKAAPRSPFRLDAARKIRLSYALVAFSAALLVVVVAAEVASA